jgi:hypothetical protein
MADFLFIQPSEISSTTIMGGNVDIDKYIFCVADTQLSVIEPLLGTELYDLILAGATADNLTGLYSTLYTEYVKPIVKHQALAEYVTVSGFMISNGGAFKHLPENSELMDKDEKALVSGIYSGIADTYIQRFLKWICKNPLTEYKTSQDDVDASRDVSLAGGWYFGSEEQTLYE